MNLNKASVAVALPLSSRRAGLPDRRWQRPTTGTTATGDSRGRIKTVFTKRSHRKRKRSTTPS